VLQAADAFTDQISRDLAGNIQVLDMVASGHKFYDLDGVDNTAFRQADAQCRLADCEAILSHHAR
jgi:hypothetical protein